MPSGFEAWNQNGFQTFSTTDYVFQLITIITFGGDTGTGGSVNVPEFALPGVVGHAHLHSMQPGGAVNLAPEQLIRIAPNIWISGTVVNWNWPNWIGTGNKPICKVLCGIR